MRRVVSGFGQRFLAITVAWPVAVPVFLIYAAVRFIMQALFGIRLQRSNHFDAALGRMRL